MKCLQSAPSHLLLLASSLVLPTLSSAARDASQTATLYYLPVEPRPTNDAPSPVELAILSYNPNDVSVSKIISFTPPPPPNGAENVSPENITLDSPLWQHKTQILTYLSPPSSSAATAFGLLQSGSPYRTSVTTTLSLQPAFSQYGRFRLVLSPLTSSSSSSPSSNDKPQVIGATWHGRIPTRKPAMSAAKAKRLAREKREREEEKEREKIKSARKAAKKSGGPLPPLPPPVKPAAEASLKPKPNPRGDFDIQFQQEAKGPIFDRPPRRYISPGGGAASNKDTGGGSGKGRSWEAVYGEGEARTEGGEAEAPQDIEDEEGEPEEKSFIQKYWWLLAAVALLAVTTGGGGEG